MAAGPVRALIAGELWHGSSLRGLGQGFRNMGWSVNEIELTTSLEGRQGIAQRIVKRLTQPIERADYNRAILNAAEQMDADVMVTVKGSWIDVETIVALKARGTRTVNFYPDPHFAYVGVSEAAIMAYDFIVTTKYYQLDWLAERRAPGSFAFIEHGYSPALHRPLATGRSWSELPFDIAYLGNATRYKADWLTGIARANPTRSIIIGGGGWGKYARATPLEAHVTGRQYMGDSAAEFLSGARINIALHGGPLGPDGASDSVSTRSFEIPACGAFMLHIDNPEIRKLFDVGAEIDVFDSPESLAERVTFYLANPDVAQRMAKAAHRRAVPAYSLDARAKEIAVCIGLSHDPDLATEALA